MDDRCVLCGQPTEGGKLTCDTCDEIAKGLSPRQKKAFEKLVKDEKSRKELKAAIDNILAETARIMEPIFNEICKIAESYTKAKEREKDG